MIFNWLSNLSHDYENLCFEDYQKIINSYKQFSSRIQQSSSPIKTITYNEVISYINSEYPKIPNYKKSVVLKTNNISYIIVLFLDKNNNFIFKNDNTPYGCKFAVNGLDEKLDKAFGKTNLFVLIHKNIVSSISDLHNSLAESWGTLKDLFQIPPIEPILTYEEALEYFVANRPSDERVKKGFIARKRYSQGYFLLQYFVDDENNIVCDSRGKPYGRKLIVERLDEELEEKFGEYDLIIVE